MTIRNVAAAAALAMALCGAAKAETCNLGLMASLDMTMLPDGRFTVPVSVNGSPQTFMVDTSSIYTEMASEPAHKLGLKDAPVDVSLYGANGKARLTAATVDLKLGGIDAKDFHIAVEASRGDTAQPSDSKTGIDVVGLLAPDLLSQFDIELDFVAKKLNLFSQDHCPGKVVYWTRGGYAELPFRFTSHSIYAVPKITLDMTLDGHAITAQVDTGSSGSWLRKQTSVQVFGLDENSQGVTKSPFARDDYPVLRKQFAALSIGGLTVQNPVVDISPPKEDEAFRMEHSEKSRDDPIYGEYLVVTDFKLGMNVLSKLHSYIAYKERKIYITPAQQH